MLLREHQAVCLPVLLCRDSHIFLKKPPEIIHIRVSAPVGDLASSQIRLNQKAAGMVDPGLMNGVG